MGHGWVPRPRLAKGPPGGYFLRVVQILMITFWRLAMFRRFSLLSALALVFVILGSALPSAAQSHIRFMMDPHVSGDLIAFSYQGDIWLVHRDGTPVRRLTNHLARNAAPRFSPDGRWVAFSSDRFGNYDVFLVPVEGGEPKQLTFHTTGDLVRGWTPDGRIMFASSRSVHPFLSPLYTVSPEGGLPLPMAMDQAANAAVSPDGRYVVYNRTGVSTSRKGARGNATADLYIMDQETGRITQLTDTDFGRFREHAHDGLPMWGADGMIYFVSERDGIFNLWKMAPDGGQVTQVTRYADGGVKYPSMSADGRTIVYTQHHELFVLDVPDGQPQPVPVRLAFDPSNNRVEWVQVSNQADGFSVDPEGKTVAVDSRGEIFLVPVDPRVGEKTQVTSSPWRDRFQQFSPDGKLLAYVSDEGAREELWVAELATGERRRISDHDSFKTSGFVWSPDSRRIAFVAANTILEVDVTSGRSTEVGYNENRGFSLSEYSPDGRWLVYSRFDLDENSEVYLFQVESRNEVNVTRDPFMASGGALTPDGSHLLFRSNRDGGTNHLFAVSLARLTEDPDDPLVRARRPEAADTAGPGAARARAGGDAAQARPLTIHTEGIRERARQLTSGENGVGDFFLSADGRTVYYTSRDNDGPGLFSMPVAGGDSRKVASGTFANLQPTKDRRTLFFSRGREVHHMPLTGASPRAQRVDFAFSVRVDHRAEWEQIFEEAWRVMKYRFYDPDMHGRDWDAIKAAYKPLLAHVGRYEDAYELTNQMIGELNASHVGVSGPSSVSMQRPYQTRFPGFELEPAQGRYRVSHVYRDGPADREWLDIKVGDFVLALEGEELRAGDNYWKILNHTLNDYVTVRLADTPGGGNARDLRIRTVPSLNNIQYEEWVEGNREFVERESGGKIAYVHIRSMNQPSLARFRNEINRFWNAQGIVIDIRYNGGGNIDQELLDILERRPFSYWNSRWAAPSAGRRPRQAIAGPQVMLINARSGSDSEVTPKGFRDLGLGTIVGNPTAAAVIATGSYGLINGGSIRTPGSLVVNYDPTRPHNHGINLENYGVAPDVFVINTPEDELRGFDRELKAAVDEALRMLAEGLWQYQGGGD
jgi:tricorn protease